MQIIHSAEDLAAVSGGDCSIGLDGITCTDLVDDIVDWFVDIYDNWDNYFDWGFGGWGY